MPSNPSSLLVLKFRGRGFAAFRDRCTSYESVLAVAQRNFRDLQGVPVEDVTLLSVIPDNPDQGEVKLSKETWPTVSANVHSVTITLESEMNEGRCDSPGLPDYQESGVGNGASSLSSPPLPPPTVRSLPPLPPLLSYELIPWHPHRATGRVSSSNNPATRHRPAFAGLNVDVFAASPSSIYTRRPAFQTSQSRCCSRLPGVSLRFIHHRRLPPQLVNTKTRNPSPGLLRLSPAAHLSTRPLA